MLKALYHKSINYINQQKALGLLEKENCGTQRRNKGYLSFDFLKCTEYVNIFLHHQIWLHLITAYLLFTLFKRIFSHKLAMNFTNIVMNVSKCKSIFL